MATPLKAPQTTATTTQTLHPGIQKSASENSLLGKSTLTPSARRLWLAQMDGVAFRGKTERSETKSPLAPTDRISQVASSVIAKV